MNVMSAVRSAVKARFIHNVFGVDSKHPKRLSSCSSQLASMTISATRFLSQIFSACLIAKIWGSLFRK